MREVRNKGRLLVEVNGRALIFDASTVRDAGRGASRSSSTSSRLPDDDQGPGVRGLVEPAAASRTREIDLHGCTVGEALARLDEALDFCMRDDVSELRIIHGRSGGRLRTAVHQRLSGVSSVRRFRLDPDNPGVTLVRL